MSHLRDFMSKPGCSKDRDSGQHHSESVNMLLPPNASTLLALRQCILQFESYRAKVAASANFSQKPWELGSGVKIENSQAVVAERKLFFDRLYAMLYWPCIVSRCPPPSNPEVKISVLKTLIVRLLNFSDCYRT